MRGAVVLALLMIGGAAEAVSAADDPRIAAPLRNTAMSTTTAISLSPEFRLRVVTRPDRSMLRVDNPDSPLRTGFGGALVDLFPFSESRFHLSAGGRLYGRAGRPHLGSPESLNLLPSLRLPGPRMSRRFAPAMMMGYGGAEEEGVSFGVDAGLTLGRLNGAAPERAARPAGSARIGGSDQRLNPLARATMLLRF